MTYLIIINNLKKLREQGGTGREYLKKTQVCHVPRAEIFPKKKISSN